MAQVANRAINGADQFLAANGEHGFSMLMDEAEARAYEQTLMGTSSALQERYKNKRQYLCPYASAKI